MNKLAGIVIAIVVLGLSTHSAGASAATECTGPLPLSGKVTGGVAVHGFCIIDAAQVSGGVQVYAGGILIMCGSTINGGLAADGAAEILVGAEEIGCEGDVINGGAQIRNTGVGAFLPAPSIALERSVINGAVHLIGNQGMIAVASDTIAGGLFCSDNAYDLDNEGLANVVKGPVRCTFE